MGNMIDPSRHFAVFNPDAFGSCPVHIIGCGATGSRIAMEVAKLGIQRLHLWDFDIVEEHNLANQLFGLEDIGAKKVDALAARIKRDTGLDCIVHDRAVDGRTVMQGVVFLLTDTMASRKEIWEGALRFKPSVRVVIETRMGRDEGRVYTVQPIRPDEIQFWESTLCSDEESSESLCGSQVTVGPTAALVTANAVWAFLRWFRWTNDGNEEKPETENLFWVSPPICVTNTVS